MNVAYVSRRCDDCTLFVRLAAGRIRLVYVEEASEIPWYIESVPTVVLETRGEDGEVGYDLYAGDDAFALVEPRRGAPAPKLDERAQKEERAPSVDEGPCALGGNDGAVFECVGAADESSGMSCGAFEALVPLGTDADKRRTESTMAEWERALAEERAKTEKKETSKLERDFEQLKKERGN
jgi:hypothetical protein